MGSSSRTINIVATIITLLAMFTLPFKVYSGFGSDLELSMFDLMSISNGFDMDGSGLSGLSIQLYLLLIFVGFNLVAQITNSRLGTILLSWGALLIFLNVVFNDTIMRGGDEMAFGLATSLCCLPIMALSSLFLPTHATPKERVTEPEPETKPEEKPLRFKPVKLKKITPKE